VTVDHAQFNTTKIGDHYSDGTDTGASNAS
jgi:hypothetical protein